MPVPTGLFWSSLSARQANVIDFPKHYTKSHKQINHHSITPVGPLPDILPLDEEVPAVAAAKK